MPARCPLVQACLSAVVVVAAAACSSESRKPDASAQGTVYLEQISDPSFQAAHPIQIDASVIALALNGIVLPNDTQAAGETSTPRRAFAGSEVGYLAPLISESLRRAESRQQVGFNVGGITGVVYAYGRSLYVTLNEYRSGAGTVGGTGMAGRSLAFVPEAAKRPDSYLDPKSGPGTVAIDYELLAKLPPASVPSGAAMSRSAPPQGPGAGKAEAGRDAEIEALRKELQEIKKQLAEQQAERARSQQKTPVPQQ
jgi:hypothetical protein